MRSGTAIPRPHYPRESSYNGARRRATIQNDLSPGHKYCLWKNGKLAWVKGRFKRRVDKKKGKDLLRIDVLCELAIDFDL